jgi:hypothetical protein
MKNMRLIIILSIIIAFCVAGYYFLQTFSKPQNVSKYPAPPFIKLSTSPSSANLMTKTSPASSQCTQGQLQATIIEQAGAGNIYGKTACSLELGNTIAVMTDTKNVTIHYQKTAPNMMYILAPGANVYSQVHYPNGPQCQSGISPKPITFLYKSGQISDTFQSKTPHMGTLMIQACTSPTEKTTIDIWPLSISPINP